MLLPLALTALTTVISGADPNFRLADGLLKTNREYYYSGTAIQRLPSGIAEDTEISVIIRTNEDALLDAYEKTDRSVSFASFAASAEADAIREAIRAEKAELLALLDEENILYGKGADYSSVLAGFEIVIRAGDFETMSRRLDGRATPIVSEVYLPEKTELVENSVNVYDTGIFDSSSFAYDGTGMVIAVLDTGLDYNHTAFSTANLPSDRSKLGLTFTEVAALVGSTRASILHAGLTASDVYVNDKVPFGFDYADYDPDIYPINQDHGTHVSGIIAGKDDTITGVAPMAQLVEMKIFSDTETSARASWILAALEDCVVLGVDVINLSIGTSCGFSRETDKEQMSGVYDRIREAGIAMVVAASNSYNSTYGSEKNGNLGLTSNPDSATIGSPATYKGTLSVASIEGAKTPYILFGEGADATIIYFEESSDRVNEEKNFFDELLAGGETEREVEFVRIPGAGRSADYTGIDVTGKIALVRRGDTTFEEKANTAQKKGAAGVIIYNNVSGDIKMNVGDTTIPVCSIRQDDGELLAATESGKIRVARSQVSGPFMSDFSSWGPTPDLRLKPEITAHGGSILSAVPGQDYDRISGTSMACPNIAGVSALLRGYVMDRFPAIKDDPVKVTAMVNRLLMSTADVVYNTNGLPYSVRKQGAGLANLNASAATAAYILTYDRLTGEEMDTSKIELGDDPQKKGVYTLKFSIVNFGSSTLSYDISAYVMTEGVSDTKTSHGETTVTEQGYRLDADVVISTVSGGEQNGMTVSVAAGKTATVTMTLTLTDADRAYLDASFKNGMYVEGFLMLCAKEEGSVDLGLPYLGFYGDWTRAPLFDLDYFATNKDELDDSIDLLDKTLPDAYATRPIGGLEDDYVSYLGSYYFEQDPANKIIAADRKYISISNQPDTVNSLRFVWAGLLRNAEHIDITITEDATGEVVYTKRENDIRKSYGDGGSIYPANVDIEFSAIEQNLKNNTKYTVTLKGYLDYGDGGEDTNLANEFSFPLTTDFLAPAVTGCEFYTEPDYVNKTTRLFAKIAVYDNHYAMALQIGYVGMQNGEAMLNTFDRYMTPVYSEYNGTTYAVYELTDYIDEIRENAVNGNCFTVACYDYALNQAVYEIDLPDSYLDFYFEETELTLSPNEVYKLEPLAYPGTEWSELLEYYSSNSNVAHVVNNELVAVAPGTSLIIARDPVTRKQAYINLTVLGEGDDGYRRYDKPVAADFKLTGYRTDKAFYFLSSEERDIGVTDDERKFNGTSYALSMFPSEAVTLRYRLDAYFPEATEVRFDSSNTDIVTVDENGKITAVAEGYASISVRVYMDNRTTYYSQTISITVKDPYILTGPSLTHYFGLGGLVHIPASLSLTEIGQYAFSNFDYIPKTAEDEISDEMPERTKIAYIGDNTIEEIIIPEGVKKIGPYAFAGLTKLKKVTLPSTIERIDQGAFLGCTSLETVVGLQNVKFLNQRAFEGCALTGSVNLDAAIAIADYAFAGCSKLAGVTLGEDTRTVGAFAFAGNSKLVSFTVKAEKIKLGTRAFEACTELPSIVINASVIPSGTFDGCRKLASVTLGADVEVIGEYAFRHAALTSFTLAEGNTAFKLGTDGKYLLNADGSELMLVAPGLKDSFTLDDANVVRVGMGAFSNCTKLKTVSLPNVTQVAAYGFADCEDLTGVTLGTLTEIGDYAFCGTRLSAVPALDGVATLGKYAFSFTPINAVVIPDGMTVGEGAFYSCTSLASVNVGDGVTVGKNAFRLDRDSNFEIKSYTVGSTKYYYYSYTSALTSLTLGEGVTLEEGAFYGAAALTEVTLGEGTKIGAYAFYNTPKLTAVHGLADVAEIGDYAFSGDVLYEFTDSNMQSPAYDASGYYRYRFYAATLTSADLSGISSLGEGAFSYCTELISVTLPSSITEIPVSAFMGCSKLASIDLSHITHIGAHAFESCALTTVALPLVREIGEMGFYGNKTLTTLILPSEAGVRIGYAAFADSPLLEDVTGLAGAAEIGDYAFAYTKLDELDLSGAVSIGDYAFAKDALTPVTVKLGADLAFIGENPFAFCRIPAFFMLTTEVFNGVTYPTAVYSFDISDAVTVIDGSLYRYVPNGLEMIAYAGDADEVRVADGTVRLAAYAFAGTAVERVYLPSELASIGSMAFYYCNDLKLVCFTSYNAPILEEEYDENYFYSFENLPATGEYEFMLGDGSSIDIPGLGIVPYFMWNVSSTPTAVYYGANFVDYIGHTDGDLLMIRPTNGKNYASFIFSQYFGTALDGAAAADSVTLAAIEAIARIPERVTLADKALVEAARAAYAKIGSLEQQALVLDYTRLTAAEKRISDLEYLENGEGEGEGPTDEPNGIATEVVVYILLGSLLALAVAAAAVFGVLYFKAHGKRFAPVTDESAEKAPAVEPVKEAEPTEAAKEPEEAPHAEGGEDAPATEDPESTGGNE